MTAFLRPQSQIAEPNWWTDLTGESPEARISNPRQGSLQEQGSYHGGTLILAVQPERVDWHFTAVPIQTLEPPATIPVLGSIPESLDIFRSLAIRWLKLSPPITRLAVGGVLLKPSQDRPGAYRILVEYVRGLHLDSENCSDFLYQINRPRTSTVRPGLLINRLMKWSAAAINLLQFAVSASTPATTPVPPISQVELYLAARLELDLSTAAESNSEFNASELPALFGELASLGLEIAERGDIP